MLIYLIVFNISIIFTILCENKLKKHKRKAAIFFSVIAVIMPCLLAGLRAPGVGIDSGTYAYTDFMIALRSGHFSTYLLHSSVKELLYPIIVYISSRISDHFFVLYFVSQILINAPVYVALFLLKEKRKDISIVVSYAAFLFLYYNLSLSIIRQSMATSFIFLGFTIYKLNKKIKVSSILLYICAILLHAFALVIVASIIILARIINDKKKELWKKTLIIGAIIGIVLNINNILMIAANLAPGFMAKYINTFNYINRSGLSNGDTLMKFVFFATCVIGTKKESGKYELSLKSYTFISAIGIVFQFVSIVSEYLIRISYYYQFFMIVPIGMFYMAFGKQNKTVLKLASIILLFAYWYIVYINWKWHGTMPFEFMSY